VLELQSVFIEVDEAINICTHLNKTDVNRILLASIKDVET